MKCKSMCKHFSACADRDLSFAEEARLREHLRECPECAREFDCFERMLGLLEDLPESDPGPDFYAAVRRRIQTEGSSIEESEPSAIGRWLGRVGGWLRPALPRPALLRPAFGAAFLGIAIGLLVGTQVPQVGRLLAGEPGSRMPASSSVSEVESGTEGLAAGGEYRSPVADIDLDRLAAMADTVHLEGETEYVLERYLTDRQRGLVPADLQGQPVMDNSSDVFITF
ncbi:MAG: anti-sigma factor [Candidatus Eisenbacteria bacterium]